MSPKDTSPESSKTVQELYDTYEQYRRDEIKSRRFTQVQMIQWLQPMLDQNVVRPTPLGASAEGRIITLYSYGMGPAKVLLWSQMHGDEPTATMALLDILNFFARHRNHPLITTIHDSLTLLIIPMLNPDGAERFTRRTAQLVDMNRDAVTLVTPEANILKDAWNRYRPEFGFNLHDQEPRLTVGATKNVAAIALLAPAMNESREDNDVRLRAKKVASVFAGVLGQLVPGHAAKYDDSFEARAFGDSIQRWGTSTVLVESGGWPNDRDKMFIRKLNYVGLLTSLYAIAAGDHERSDPAAYESLPFNTKNLYDLIVHGVELKANNRTPSVRVDVAFNIEEERQTDGTVRLIAKLVDVGDLSSYGAFEERDGSGKILSGVEIQLDRTFSLNQVELLLKQD
jgi:hypothetical protein